MLSALPIMMPVAQAPFSDCFEALKHDGLILIDGIEMIEFPKAYLVTQQVIDPDIILYVTVFGWRGLTDAERLSIVRSSKVYVLFEYFSDAVGCILRVKSRAGTHHKSRVTSLGLRQVRPRADHFAKGLTENPMIRVVTYDSLGSPEFAEVIATAERHKFPTKLRSRNACSRYNNSHVQFCLGRCSVCLHSVVLPLSTCVLLPCFEAGLDVINRNLQRSCSSCFPLPRTHLLLTLSFQLFSRWQGFQLCVGCPAGSCTLLLSRWLHS